VRERVLHDREVEAPEDDGDEKEDVCWNPLAHGPKAMGAVLVQMDN
jgi:hypothetical protein